MELLIAIGLLILLVSSAMSIFLFSELKALSRTIPHSLRGEMDSQFSQLRLEMDSKHAILNNTLHNRLETLQNRNDQQLEAMRKTVDEKLQDTLGNRLDQSYRQVSQSLEAVQKGLGEMQTLAAGVGDLKKVLTNVKRRGTWAEVQLGKLLEDMLAPSQFAKEVAVADTRERVDYAIKLPGEEGSNQPVWLPIDAKYPIEAYSRLIDASERGDAAAVDAAGLELGNAVKASAKMIRSKYISPPQTTDFAILYLATEGLYAEIMRRPGFAEGIQREERVVLSGPSTLAALLTSLQVGFQTLAIQKRSSEVWELLGKVKRDFTTYSDLLDKVDRKLEDARSVVADAKKRSEQINKKLFNIQAPDSPAELAQDTAPD
jgi:DNA recombination protein RmuC